MSWAKKHPAFAIAWLILGLLLLAEAVGVGVEWTAARTAARRLNLASRALRSMTAIQPAPTAENAGQIEADLARTTRELPSLQAGWKPATDRKAAAPTQARRSDVFFDLAAFVEAMRRRAQLAGIALKPDERFGFSAYAHEAPVAGHLAQVSREQQMMQCLLGALIDARPHELRAAQRERPAEIPGRKAAGESVEAQPGRSTGGGTRDYFDLDPRLSLRVPGMVDTTAFRISFTGHTATLRGWLNKLAETGSPVSVRAVEVEPADAAAARDTPSRPVLTAAAWSQFTVTVEFITRAPTLAPTT